MSDAPEAPIAASILDLGPALVARRQRDCKHERVVVDETDDVLECATCGVEVNPYTWIRYLADDENLTRTRLKQSTAEAWKNYRALHASLQAKLEHVRAEVNHLIETKNRLWNEPHPTTGQPLGAAAARVRRRRTTTK